METIDVVAKVIDTHFDKYAACNNGCGILYEATKNDFAREYIRERGYLGLFHKILDKYHNNRSLSNMCCMAISLFESP